MLQKLKLETKKQDHTNYYDKDKNNFLIMALYVRLRKNLIWFYAYTVSIENWKFGLHLNLLRGPED